MKPFHSYRDGLPPGPGVFATDESIDKKGTPIRIGDIVSDPGQRARGLVIAIAGDVLIYLVDEPDEGGDLDWFMPGNCRDVTIIGHVYNVPREIARIEAAGDAADLLPAQKTVDP